MAWPIWWSDYRTGYLIPCHAQNYHKDSKETKERSYFVRLSRGRINGTKWILPGNWFLSSPIPKSIEGIETKGVFGEGRPPCDVMLHSIMDSQSSENNDDREPSPAKKPRQTQDQACQVDGIPGNFIPLIVSFGLTCSKGHHAVVIGQVLAVSYLRDSDFTRVFWFLLSFFSPKTSSFQILKHRQRYVMLVHQLQGQYCLSSTIYFAQWRIEQGWSGILKSWVRPCL